MLFKNNMVTHGPGCTFECEGDSQGTLAEESEDMTHMVLFCLTTHAECPSLAAG